MDNLEPFVAERLYEFSASAFVCCTVMLLLTEFLAGCGGRQRVP